MKLNKKLKASIYAWLIHSGYWNYFDRCEWVPTQHKFRYVCADEDCKVYYVSQRQLAKEFDRAFTKPEQNDFANEYLDDLEVAGRLAQCA